MPRWKALEDPGARQMGLLRRVFESRPFTLLVPDRELVVEGPSGRGVTVRAARASDGSFAFVYSPRGERFTVDKSAIPGRRVGEIWWDPRCGVARHFHATDDAGFQTYTPPTSGRGMDWLLILESEAARFPLPGALTPASRRSVSSSALTLSSGTTWSSPAVPERSSS